MKFSRVFTTHDLHTCGEPTRVVVGGVPCIPCKTMIEKKRWMEENADFIRRALILEPRGHRDMFGAVITSPEKDDACAGVIMMDSGGYLDMCVHGSIAVATVLVETGMVGPPIGDGDGLRSVALDTPAGRICASAQVEDGRVISVTIRNVPSFFCRRTTVELDDFGSVPVEVAFGGNYFALVNAKDLNVAVCAESSDVLRDRGLEIRKKIREQGALCHPETGVEASVNLVEIFSHQPGEIPKNVVIFGDGQLDRSPCGTGTSAKMATMHHHGKLGLNEPFRYRGILGTEFRGILRDEHQLGSTPGVVPEISGRAYITGMHTFVVDPDDPLKFGFKL